MGGMIFSGEHGGLSHIDMIREGTKMRTRRMSDNYYVGKTYAVQPGRGKKAVPDIRIRILEKWQETRNLEIGTVDALEEGKYTPGEYETLFAKMYPHWWTRWAYKFEVVKIG